MEAIEFGFSKLCSRADVIAEGVSNVTKKQQQTSNDMTRILDSLTKMREEVRVLLTEQQHVTSQYKRVDKIISDNRPQEHDVVVVETSKVSFTTPAANRRVLEEAVEVVSSTDLHGKSQKALEEVNKVSSTDLYGKSEKALEEANEIVSSSDLYGKCEMAVQLDVDVAGNDFEMETREDEVGLLKEATSGEDTKRTEEVPVTTGEEDIATQQQ